MQQRYTSTTINNNSGKPAEWMEIEKLWKITSTYNYIYYECKILLRVIINGNIH